MTGPAALPGGATAWRGVRRTQARRARQAPGRPEPRGPVWSAACPSWSGRERRERSWQTRWPERLGHPRCPRHRTRRCRRRTGSARRARQRRSRASGPDAPAAGDVGSDAPPGGVEARASVAGGSRRRTPEQRRGAPWARQDRARRRSVRWGPRRTRPPPQTEPSAELPSESLELEPKLDASASVPLCFPPFVEVCLLWPSASAVRATWFERTLANASVGGAPPVGGLAPWPSAGGGETPASGVPAAPVALPAALPVPGALEAAPAEGASAGDDRHQRRRSDAGAHAALRRKPLSAISSRSAASMRACSRTNSMRRFSFRRSRA